MYCRGHSEAVLVSVRIQKIVNVLVPSLHKAIDLFNREAFFGPDKGRRYKGNEWGGRGKVRRPVVPS